ncbi:MAG: pilus assembly protein CpaE [Pseudomonadota bacterium]
MKNALESAFSHEDHDDEEGVAEGAASLGPDGGPAAAGALDTLGDASDDLEAEFEDDLDDLDAWLDEELSDEELAALADEDFSDIDFSDEELAAAGFDLDGEGGLETDSPVAEAEEPAGAGSSSSETEISYSSVAEYEPAPSDHDFAEGASSEDPFDNDAFSTDAFSDDPEAGASDAAGIFDQVTRAFDGVEGSEDLAGSSAPSSTDFASSDFDDEDEGAEPEFEVDETPAPVNKAVPQTDSAEASEHAHEAGALVAARDIAPNAPAYDPASLGIDTENVDHSPVPRISIHAFCETPATTALMEKAAVDRRLAKAHLTIHMGGISKAIDQFNSAATPNLIILETVAEGAEIFAQLGELAEVCDPSTKVVIVGQINDIILYRELIRQGVSEYIVRPQSPLQIIKTIADLYVDPSAPPIGRTVAFVGARGGVGSSTIAHNVGWCAAEDYKSDTVILDLDLPFGTTSLNFDQEASAGLVEALSSPERLDDVLLDRLLQKYTDHLSLFTAPSVLDRDYDLDDQAFETVLDIVRNAAPTVVVDVPHLWTNWSKRVLTTADEIVVTATPDLAAFRNTKNFIDLLSASRPNDASPKLIVNMFDPKVSAVRPEQFAEHVGIKPEQVFLYEPQLFGAAATNAAPICEVGPKSKAANGFRDLAAQLIGQTNANIAKPKFSLLGLFKSK